MEKRTKESTKRINSLILLIAFTAIMLIVSTYAWFTSQKDITLSNLRGTVEVSENMEISLDAKTWAQEFDLSDLSKLTTAYNDRETAVTGSAAPALLPTELLPVSGMGETGETVLPLYSGTAKGVTLETISQVSETTGTDNKGFFAFDVYIKNTAKDGADDVLQMNVNSKAWVLPEGFSITKNIDANTQRTYVGDANSGLQNTLRIGIALYGTKSGATLNGIAKSTDNQATILNTTKGVNVSQIAIWEPNYKSHAEYVVSNNNKYTNGLIDQTDFTADGEQPTYALKAASEGQTLTNVYDISSTFTGLQNTFKTEPMNPAAGDHRIKSTDGGDTDTIPDPINIKNIAGSDFTITSNTVTKARIYIWLEGQDVDCINLASQGGGIEVDLGLTKDGEVGDVYTAANATP